VSSNLIRWGGLAGVVGGGRRHDERSDGRPHPVRAARSRIRFVHRLSDRNLVRLGVGRNSGHNSRPLCSAKGALRTHRRGGLLNGLRRPRALTLGGDGHRFSGTRGSRCCLPFGRPGGARWAGALGGRDFAGAGVAAMVQGIAHRRFPSHDIFDLASGGAGRIVQEAIWVSVGYALLSSSGASAQQPSRVS
jgi:hypothetical protein